MGSVNKVILVGNLGRDAELRYTPGGAAVATLNMATTEVWNDKSGQRQEKTEWHRVVLLGGGSGGGRGGSMSGSSERSGSSEFGGPGPEGSAPLTDDDIPF